MQIYNVKNRPQRLTLKDEVVVCDVKHSIRLTKGYYLDTGSNRLNGFAFQKLGLDPRKAAIQIYGYDRGGSFPFADSLSDLVNMVNFLIDEEEDSRVGKSQK